MEFVGIVAMIAAILGAFKLLHEAIAFLNQYIPEYSNFVPFIAFLGLFVGILILINLLGKLTKKLAGKADGKKIAEIAKKLLS